MNPIDTLFEKAAAVRLKAYAPYSKFFVGACIETDSGKLFAGCNVENASYGAAICAEGSAVTAMVAAGERQIKQVAIVVEGPDVCAPCGVCRQRMYEFSTPDTLVHLFDLAGNKKTYRMSELFPHPFGPKDLSNSGSKSDHNKLTT